VPGIRIDIQLDFQFKRWKFLSDYAGYEIYNEKNKPNNHQSS